MIGETVVVTCAKRIWLQFEGTPTGIMKAWDEREAGPIHFKIPQKPSREVGKVIVNIDGKLRGTFNVSEIKQLNLSYLKSHNLEHFKPGWFIICDGTSWVRLDQEVPRPPNRGYTYYP